MAQKNAETRQKKMSKDVQIVCYLDVEDCEDKRDVHAQLFDDDEYYEKETRERSKAVVSIGDEDFSVSSDMRKAIKEADSGEIEVVTRENEVEKFVKGTANVAPKIRRDSVSGVDMALSQLGLELKWSWKVQKDDRTVFDVDYDYLQQMGLLNHQSQIEDGNRWEDKDAALWCVTLNISVSQVKPDIYRWFDEQVIPEIVNNAAKHEWVSRTRVLDCEKEYKEEGVCYGI